MLCNFLGDDTYHRQKAHGCWITGRASLEGKQGAARGWPCSGDDKRTHPYSRVDESEKCLDCEWTISPRNLPHYSAAKAGTTMVMKELARAYGPHGIRVNAIAPGAIPGVGFPADPVTSIDKIAMGRVGTPEDTGNAAIGLLSNQFSAFVTAITLVVDGGSALFNWIAPIRG